MKPVDLVGKGLGYIKLFRQIEDSEVFVDGLFRVFIWCILRANYKTKWVPIKVGKTGQKMIHVQRGTFLYGRDSAAEKLKLPPSTVRNRINRLEELGMIRVDSDKDRRYSVLTVVNYDMYQGEEKSKDSKQDRRRTEGGQKEDTTNKDKKEKKDNITLEDVVRIYHGVLPELPKVIKLTPQRETLLSWAVTNDPVRDDLAWWDSFFKLARKYPMVMDPKKVFAPQKPQFVPNFDWLLRDVNMTKILEGAWDTEEEVKNKSPALLQAQRELDELNHRWKTDSDMEWREYQETRRRIKMKLLKEKANETE